MNLLENGFEIIEDFISENWVNKILAEIESADFSMEVSGVRHINKKLSVVAEYLSSDEFKNKAHNHVFSDAGLVRAILFNKSPESNWYVTWHQDKTVAVSKKFEEVGWSVWSIKENVLHVQPPLNILETMVTIRIHLDSAKKENGCLKVIPNSHKFGILSSDAISEIVASDQIYLCEAPKRAALIMRPHLLHASSKSSTLDSRRILHFEFSHWKLPKGVHWS